MGKLRVSTVKYANSYPLNWGILNGPVSGLTVLDFDHPSGIARKLAGGEADIGLLPVAALRTLSNYVITGDYCIGTRGSVRTVMLLSNSRLEDIESIWLDHRSVTSVNLVKVLANHYWKKQFAWHNPDETFRYDSVGQGEAIVIIGDQCFQMEGRFRFRYDLGLEWNRFTGLPFVFAAWVAVADPGSEFRRLFNQSLEWGIASIGRAVREMNTGGVLPDEDILNYLTTNIDYRLDESKREAMSLFIKYLTNLTD